MVCPCGSCSKRACPHEVWWWCINLFCFRPIVTRGTKQVFIPSVAVEYESTHHADILCTLGPMMNEAEWKEKGLDNYGLIAVNSQGNAAQVK